MNMIKRFWDWVKPKKPAMATVAEVVEACEALADEPCFKHLTQTEIICIMVSTQSTDSVARRYNISTEDVRAIRRGRYKA